MEAINAYRLPTGVLITEPVTEVVAWKAADGRLFECPYAAQLYEAEQRAKSDLADLVEGNFHSLVDNDQDVVDEIWRVRCELMDIFAPLIAVAQAQKDAENADVPF